MATPDEELENSDDVVVEVHICVAHEEYVGTGPFSRHTITLILNHTPNQSQIAFRWCRVKCGVRDAGKCRRVKCGEKCGSHPAIYTHELERVQQHALRSAGVYQLQRSGHSN